MLSVRLTRVLRSSVAKLGIALCALSVALAATGAHADACYSKSKFGSIYDFGDHTGDPLSPTYVGVIAQGRDGNFWSTTPVGGTNANGTAFSLTPGGKLKVIYDFTTTTGQPFSGLTLGTDGNFYGTTSNGGTPGAGTVFKLTPKGVLTTLYTFTGGNDGKVPLAPPIEGTDGNFYGTTDQGGASKVGTIYQITPSGKLTTMYQFDGPHGANPVGALVQGTDGNWYGTTVNGGAANWGTIFKIASSGNFTFTLLFSFNFTDGGQPYAGLVQGSDGNFYGTTNTGGSSRAGVVFKITSKGSYTELYPLNGSTDGANPWGLVQATDGNFYGDATNAGNGYGTFFRITPKGKFTVCEDFNATLGANGRVTPIQLTNGGLYGDTTTGGDKVNTGVFYELDFGFKPFVSLLPTSGKIGAKIEILGQGFVPKKTEVSFNGAGATQVNVMSATYITATVPNNATTGFVTVTTPTATLQSNKKFRVTK